MPAATDADDDLEPGDFYGTGHPCRPCRHPPGSRGKVDVMVGRFARGEELFHDQDGRVAGPAARRKRRPCEQGRTDEYRAADAARKRAERARKKAAKKVLTIVSDYSFGPHLAGLRAGARFSQRELARRAGVSVAVVCQLERGHRVDPGLGVLCRLADALNVTLDLLAGRKAR